MSVIINFVGRLGADAEIVTTGSTPFISCRVAVDENVKKEQQTRWITVNGGLDSFKNMVKYLTKGKLVQVRGIERVTPYVSKSGEAGVDTRVWADGIDFISTGKPNEQSQNNEQAASSKDEQNAQMTTGKVKEKAKKEPETETSMFDNNGEDDLPF